MSKCTAHASSLSCLLQSRVVFHCQAAIVGLRKIHIRHINKIPHAAVIIDYIVVSANNADIIVEEGSSCYTVVLSQNAVAVFWLPRAELCSHRHGIISQSTGTNRFSSTVPDNSVFIP